MIKFEHTIFALPFAYLTLGGALCLVLFSEEAVRILVPEPFYGAIPIAGILAVFYGLQFFGKQP